MLFETRVVQEHVDTCHCHMSNRFSTGVHLLVESDAGPMYWMKQAPVSIGRGRRLRWPMDNDSRRVWSSDGGRVHEEKATEPTLSDGKVRIVRESK